MGSQEFVYYLDSMLSQLAKLFPKCGPTAAICTLVKTAYEGKDEAAMNRFMDEWRNFTATEQFQTAYRSENLEAIGACGIPILEVLGFQDKIREISATSRATLMKFVQRLNDIAGVNNSQALVFPERMERETSVAVDRRSASASSQFPNADQIMSQLPPEMAPLIELARQFIVKLPEAEVERMFGSIANIGQTVINNYEGPIPNELGGEYFADILKKTFTAKK